MASGERIRATVARVSPIIRAAPRGEPHEPLRSRWPAMTGADCAVVMVAISTLSPRTPE